MRPLLHHSPEQGATSKGVISVIHISNLFSVHSAVRALDTHLGRDVLIKVSCILWVTEVRYEGRLHPMDIIPVDSFEPHMRLRLVSRSRTPAVVTANDRSQGINRSTRATSTRDTFPGNTVSEHRSLSAFLVVVVVVKQTEQIGDQTSQLSSTYCLHGTGYM